MKIFLALSCILAFSCTSNKKEDDAATMIPKKENELKQAVNTYPDSIILTENLVQYYRENGDYTNAIKATNTAIQKDSSNSRLFDIKAILHFENADTLGAMTAFEKAVSLNPDPAYLISLGTLYAQTKNEKALRVVTLLAHQPGHVTDKEAYFIEGLYFSAINDKSKAIQSFDKALRVNFNFLEAYREKSMALYDLQNYSGALQVIEKSLMLHKSFDEGHYYRGKILEKLHRGPEAIEAYQQALMLDPDYVEAKDALAKMSTKN